MKQSFDERTGVMKNLIEQNTDSTNKVTSAFNYLFQAEDGIREYKVTRVQTCALPIYQPNQMAQLIRNTLDASPKDQQPPLPGPDRKSTRLNSSHLVISYAVFCLK